MSRYGIKEVFSTLQGEGARTGARSVWLRFSGCNLWDGHPLHRDKGEGACARWCDTDFFKGKPLDLADIRTILDEAWPLVKGQPRWVVMSGGEPMLQVDRDLLIALRADGWSLAIETNGTIDSPLLHALDFVTVSPKKGSVLKVMRGDELKVVLPGAAFGETGWTEAEVMRMAEEGSWKHLYVQPQDPVIDPSLVSVTALKPGGADDVELLTQGQMLYNAHLSQCLAFINAHPEFRLSAQTHKFLNIP